MTQKQTPPPASGMTHSLGSSGKTEPAMDSQANLDSQSVAGEEDPGAALDTSGESMSRSSAATVPMPSGSVNPGDEAPEGTPGTGEGLCRECGGSGRVGASMCPSCKGSGKVVVGIGGA